MLLKRIVISILFVIHFFLFIAFPALFFIPSSVWSFRIEFHFVYALGLFAMFHVWGLIWTLKFRNKCYRICILDTITQRLRGFRMYDPRSYDHSFVVEVFERSHLGSVKWIIPSGLFLCIVLSGLLFFLKLFGIVLW